MGWWPHPGLLNIIQNVVFQNVAILGHISVRMTGILLGLVFASHAESKRLNRIRLGCLSKLVHLWRES